MGRIVLACLLLACCPAPARAEWLQASSAHFVVYSDDSESNLRRFGERLERFHAAMAYMLNVPVTTPSPSNRVTIYVVSNAQEVRRLFGNVNSRVDGFYTGRAGGSMAVVPQVKVPGAGSSPSMNVLLHEYAHHFVNSHSAFAPPRWYSEGGAEFFGSTDFGADGGVNLGRPAEHRAPELLYARDVTVEDLLDYESYRQKGRKGFDAFYGKSWLMYHYLAFEPSRQGQMGRYVAFLAEGVAAPEAGRRAFGDFAALERELDGYMAKNKRFVKVAASVLAIGKVEVRRLSTGHAEAMSVLIRSRRGVNREKALELLPEARVLAQRHGQDAVVLGVLAKVEHDAGNFSQAVAAADAALAIDPSLVDAYVHKGHALFDMAEKSTDKASAYTRARAPFVQLNQREHDHPLPLIYFYRSYTEQGQAPTPLAIQGLRRAVEVAPFDLGLRMTLALREVKLGEPAAARRNLEPVAFNPHGGKLADRARAALAKLDADAGWDGSGLPTSEGGASESELVGGAVPEEHAGLAGPSYDTMGAHPISTWSRDHR